MANKMQCRVGECLECYDFTRVGCLEYFASNLAVLAQAKLPVLSHDWSALPSAILRLACELPILVLYRNYKRFSILKVLFDPLASNIITNLEIRATNV